MPIFLVLCLLVSVFFTSTTPLNSDLNVGTTLFTKADTYKECWSSETLALLTSRMILEDLLPSTTILVIDCNEFVSDLVEYFRLILETVRRETHGKTKHITLVALTDLLGGYLYHAVLPIAKYAYYAGLIDYESMSSLLGLFDELKLFLRTNGQGWAAPIPQTLENFEISRIPLQSSGSGQDFCKNLILLEPKGDKSPTPCDILVPLPFLDSRTAPSAIALPTKTCPLHNLEANSSNYLLLKFFVGAYKCLMSKNLKPENIQKFEEDVCGWIEEQIIPRLDDQKFYAAFGGILRVSYTFRRQEVSLMAPHKTHVDDFQNEIQQAERHEQEPENPQHMSKSSMILTAVLITIFVWFILGTSFICYKMRTSRRSQPEDDGKNPDISPSSLDSSKYFYPEPAAKQPTSSQDTDVTSASDMDTKGHTKHRQQSSLLCNKVKWSRHKSPARHEITITTCRCRDEEATAVIESNHTERRLPSITEISEQSTSENNRGRTGNSGNRVSLQAPGSSTAGSSTERPVSKVEREIYDDTETESETGETTE